MLTRYPTLSLKKGRFQSTEKASAGTAESSRQPSTQRERNPFMSPPVTRSDRSGRAFLGREPLARGPGEMNAAGGRRGAVPRRFDSASRSPAAGHPTLALRSDQ